MSNAEMETMGEESEMAEDELDTGDDEMETSDKEIESSDEELGFSDHDDNDDDELEISDEGLETFDDAATNAESIITRADEKCPYCCLHTVMAESRLHDLSPMDSDRYLRDQLLLSRVQIGSVQGCQFCALLVDAIQAWSERQWYEVETSTFMYFLRTINGQIGLCLSLEGHPDGSVFRGTGCQSAWNLCGPPQISGDTSSSEAADTASRWLRTCRETHYLCKGKDRMQKTPKRILELDGEHVKLREYFHLEGDYVCLSHCWGQFGPALKLTAGTIDVLKDGYLINKLPKTFRDAAHFCWKLGIHYLWIDALCILQDSDKDWNEATVYMADTYEGAALTIAATWSSSSNDGCFAPATTKNLGTALAEPGLYIAGSLVEFPREVTHILEDHWPLLERAWVFQERKLSTRVLHFSKDQLYWECNSKVTSEDSLKAHGGSESLSLDDFKQDNTGDTASEWRSAVEYYSELKLTYEQDRLPAISGFVKRIQERRQDDVYIAGMWLNTLLTDLAWIACEKLPPPRPDRPGTVSPSWSWISVSQGVLYMNPTPLPSLKLLGIAYDITGPAYVGQVTDASITLQGSYTPIHAFLEYERPFEIIEYQRLFCGKDGPLLEVPDSHAIWDFDIETATFAMIVEDTDEEDSINNTLESSMDVDNTGEQSSDYGGLAPSQRIDEKFFLLLTSVWELRGRDEFFGIVLHEVEGEQYERVGAILLKPPSDLSEDRSALRAQLAAERIASLPIRQFTIV